MILQHLSFLHGLGFPSLGLIGLFCIVVLSFDLLDFGLWFLGLVVLCHGFFACSFLGLSLFGFLGTGLLDHFGVVLLNIFDLGLLDTH